MLEDAQVAVFAKNEWENDPVVASANAAVAAMVAIEGGSSPIGDTRRRPVEVAITGMEGGGFVADVSRGDGFCADDRDDGFANDDAVHDYGVAGGEIACGKFVLGPDIGSKSELFAVEGERFALPKIGESDDDVVARIDAKSVSGHGPWLQGAE